MSRKTVGSILGILALAAVLVAGCGGSKGATSNSAAISVTEDGFEPKVVHVKAGSPVTLSVTRKTDKTCATELVLKEYDIQQNLPLNQTVTITFTPRDTGQLTYACGMDMYKGSIVVE